MKSITILVAAVLLSTGWQSDRQPVQETLLAYEPFDYSPQGADLLGRNGGTGFSTEWRGTELITNYDLASGSLPFTALTSLGHHARTASQLVGTSLGRRLTQVMGANGTTRYVSFLLRPEGVLHWSRSRGWFGVLLAGSLGKSLHIGKPGEGPLNYALETYGGGPGMADSRQAPVIGQTVLLVVKAEFTSGIDRFTLYVNPVPGDAEPATGAVKQDIDVGSIDRIFFNGTGEFAFDELRIGERFADVTPKSGR